MKTGETNPVYVAAYPGGPNVYLHLYFARPETEVEEEYLVYDNASFVAEIGGYLGLLLGFSALSMYQAAVETVLKQK